MVPPLRQNLNSISLQTLPFLCIQQLQVNGIIVMPNGKKARKAVVFGLNGVLEPVQRNCDVINRPRRYVSQHISTVNTTEPSGPSSYSSHTVKILK